MRKVAQYWPLLHRASTELVKAEVLTVQAILNDQKRASPSGADTVTWTGEFDVLRSIFLAFASYTRDMKSARASHSSHQAYYTLRLELQCQ
jgi:hypothetical protein